MSISLLNERRVGKNWFVASFMCEVVLFLVLCIWDRAWCSTSTFLEQTVPAHVAVKIWGTTFTTVFEKADIDNGHVHRFRDTIAVRLLEKGVSIETVSVLLGRTSAPRSSTIGRG